MSISFKIFIHLLSGKLYKAVNSRVLENISIHSSLLPSEDLAMLARVAEFVSALKDRLKTECLPNADFTSSTELYFAKLQCLADIEAKREAG